MARVVVTRPINPRAAGLLAGHEVWTWPDNRTMPRGLLLERIVEAEGALVMLTDRIDDDFLEAGSRLRVVSQMAVGVDNVDLAACTSRGIPVGHTPDVLTETTADMAWALPGRRRPAYPRRTRLCPRRSLAGVGPRPLAGKRSVGNHPGNRGNGADRRGQWPAGQRAFP